MQTILNNSYDEIAYKAAECGIDWEKARHFVDFSGRKTNLDKNTLSSKYNGKVIMYASIKTDKSGTQYPFISFYTAKHGGVRESFSGWEASREEKEKGIFTREFIPLPRMTETAKEKQAELFKKRNIEIEANRFNKLPLSDGSHPYLLRKFEKFSGFTESPAIFLNDCVRADGDLLIWAFKNEKGEITGFQHISSTRQFGDDNNPRDKNTIAGSVTAGSCLTIGDATRVEIGAILCEGLADGLALYNAPKKRGSFSNHEKLPVFVCIDARNMAVIAQQLKDAGCKNIFFGSDNDCKVKVKTRRNGTVFANQDMSFKVNTGVYTSFVKAREIGATVLIPSIATGDSCDFADTFNHNSYDLSKCDQLNFLIQLMKYAPEREFKKIARSIAFEISKEIPRKYSIDTAVAFIESALAKREFSAGSSVHSIIKREVKKRFDKVRASNKVFKESMLVHDMKKASMSEVASHILDGASRASEGAVFYAAWGMGAGKTNMAIDLSDMLPYDTLIYICHRVSLTDNACARFKIENYNGVEPWEHVQKLGLCVNSAPKFNIHQRFRAVVLDEVRQLIEHVLTGAVENRQAVFDELCLMVKSADLIIVLDADLDDHTIAFLKKYAGNKTHNLLKIDEPDFAVKTMHLMPSHDANINAMLKFVQSDKNIAVATTSIKKTVEIETFMIENGVPAEKILNINSDNKGDVRQAAFLANPNEECVKYRMVTYSPTMGTGVSIITQHFDYNFMVNCGNLTANEALQMTARNRCATDVFTSFSEQRNRNRVTDVQLLMEGEGLKAARYMTSNSNSVFSLSELGNLRIELTTRQNDDLNDYANNFITLAEMNGMVINYEHLNVELGEIEAAKFNGLATRASDTTIDAVHTSIVVSDAEIKILDEKTALTQVESNILKRHLTTKMAGTNDIEREDTKNFIKGMMKVVGLYEIFEANPADLMLWDKENYHTQDKRYSKTSLHKLLNELFEVVAADIVSISNETAVKFCQCLKKNAAELASNGMGNYAGGLPKRPMLTMSLFLKRFGYELVKTGQSSTGKRDARFRLKENDTILRYAKNRAEMFAAEASAEQS